MESELLLVYNDIRHTLSANQEDAEILRKQKDHFLLSLSRLPTPTDSGPSSAFELTLQYLRFLLESDISISAIRPLLIAFERDFLSNTDIHSRISNLDGDPSKRQELLKTYYSLASACDVSKPKDSALLKAVEHGEAQLLAVFSGQGSDNAMCFKDLADLYAMYTPLLKVLVDVTAPLINKLSCLPETRDHYYGRHLDLKLWLQNPAAAPGGDFISTAAVSMPIIGLLSLAHYCVACKVLGKSPGELRSLLQGVTGHSQGIIVATGIALSESWDSFYDTAKWVIEVLFWLGYECHKGSPRSSISSKLINESLENEEGRPSCMLSVRGLENSQVESIVFRLNKDFTVQERLYIALTNARDNSVVGGPAESLVHLNSLLRAMKADTNLDQGRIPFSRRKPTIFHHFLPISAPFHTPYLEDAARNVKLRLSNRLISATELMIPVYHTTTGKDIREIIGANVVDILIDAIACEKCDWPVALDVPNISHIIAFGGRGMGELISKIKDGRGVRVIAASDLENRDREIGTKIDLFSPRLLESSFKIENWGHKYRPQLMLAASGELMMNTKLSRLLGAPPVIVAGMTPTTAHWDFVSAVMNAGYHIELAAGGYNDSDSMFDAISKLVANVPAGKGVTCNVIYAQPKALGWQLGVLRKLSQSGAPIDGLTIGAGVPSPNVVAEYIDTLKLRHISLKPGSHAAIRQVIDIAKAHPTFPFILQWTGGRGGGHHSYEDFHAPILGLYSAIRKCSNIVLVAGSGFGSSEDTFPYLNGEWATRFGFPLMPFDGILLGSRMMVAQEAHTSLAVKELICDTQGVADSDWDKTYEGPAGGIITVISEMGQPIHQIATRGALFWAEMDKNIFSLPRKDRLVKLAIDKAYIIRRLNADFAKPWFGKNSDGQTVDLSEMTYSEVLHRLISLMYVAHQRRWIHQSYAQLVGDIATRVLERLPSKTQFEVTKSALEQPYTFLETFNSVCPKACTKVLNPEDVPFFLSRFKKRGRKPCNFIPSLDEDFETYFKKDSLWQSEDIDAVVGQDAGRVCILHGPVAARYSQDCKESAKDILDGITRPHVDMVRREFYTDDFGPLYESGVVTPASSDSGSTSMGSWSFDSPYKNIASPASTLQSPGYKTPCFESDMLSGVGTELDSIFREKRPTNSSAWIRALFSDDFVLQGQHRRSSPFRRVLSLQSGTSLQFDTEDTGFLLSGEDTTGATSCVKVTCNDQVNIVVELRHESTSRSEPLVLPLRYQFNAALTPFGISEMMTERNKHIKFFYSKLWFNEDLDPTASVDTTFTGPDMNLTRKILQDFLSTVGLSYSNSETMFSNTDIIPLSIGVFITWNVLTKPLCLQDIDGDLLNLVHLSNDFEYCKGASPLRVGDIVSSRSQVKAVYIEEAGKYVVVAAQVVRSGEPVLNVTSTFLFKGSFQDFETTFRQIEEPEMMLNVESAHDEAILRNREWFNQNCLSPLEGTTLLFKLRTIVTWKNSKTYKSLQVKGSVFSLTAMDKLHLIGMVDFEALECFGNPVMDFLKRKGTSSTSGTDLKKPGWLGDSSLEVQVPGSNKMYARISKDHNPIHVSPIFASWVGLPGTITHGMYTSSISAGIIEHLAAGGDRLRFRQFSANFTGMVLPGDRLVVRLKHTRMVQGRMQFKITAVNKDTGDKVLDGNAEIEQANTAYIFTGQGSQFQGMGMDLYESSSVARGVWDQIDKYLYDSYGWSILNIVRHNPKILTVHFGGKRGRQIRENYLAMKIEITLPDGSSITKPILKGLTHESRSYTFSESRGLLFSTQFAQPAILLLQRATYEDMQSKGLIQDGATYAGHSLGEYGSLSAFSDFLSTRALMDVVFYRGLTMQVSMARDEHGDTGHSMMAANPKRVGKFFDERALRRVITVIAAESNALLEIVNFNVEGEQYVCAGTLKNLHVLGEILNHLSNVADQGQLVKEPVDANDSAAQKLRALISSFVIQANGLPKPILLERGIATIPIKGIDIPFHSTELRPGVPSYRKYLQQHITESDIQAERLVGRWTPNVMAQPFSLEESYVKEVFKLTSSPVLKEILEGGVA